MGKKRVSKSVITVRMTPEEYAQVQQMAYARGLSMNEYCRARLVKAPPMLQLTMAELAYLQRLARSEPHSFCAYPNLICAGLIKETTRGRKSYKLTPLGRLTLGLELVPSVGSSNDA